MFDRGWTRSTENKTGQLSPPGSRSHFQVLPSRKYPNASCDYDRLAGEHVLEHQAPSDQIRCSCSGEARESVDVLEHRRVSGENRKRSARRVTHQCIVLHVEVALVASRA